MRRITLAGAALVVVAATVADAQIIRPTVRTRPVAWASLSAGWLQQNDICGADTGACWDFGGAPQFRATLEMPVGTSAALGVAATRARVPLVYSGSLVLPGSCGQCDADANVSQLFGNFRFGSGNVGFHQVIDVSAGTTIYSNFRSTDGTKLGTGKAVNDVTFGLGYGFGYSLSPRSQVFLVQEWMLVLHERQSGSSENTSAQQIVRIGGTDCAWGQELTVKFAVMRNRLAFLAMLTAACHRPTTSTVTPPEWSGPASHGSATGRRGAVASDAPLASGAGVEVLRGGGNAVDAAVATGFALAVVYPEAGNLGGGGFALVRMADGRSAAIDYREVAPLAATRDMFLDDRGRLTNKSVVGPLASGVPGAVAGLVATHQRFGRLPLASVMAPAIRLAEDGFAVDSLLARSLSRYADLIGQFAGAAVFLPEGRPLSAGATLRQPALARTLRAIADSGADAFYRGALAARVAADLASVGSIITAQDLAAYKVELREPLRATYRGHTLVTMPPPSSGVTMIEALNILEFIGPMPPIGSARHSHLVASALQRAFLDRNTLLADPAFARVPTALLASKSHAAKLRASIGDRATRTSALLPQPGEGPHTTHYSVADSAGNVVATTTTINDLYGSGVYLPTVGFFLNDEMDDFAGAPGKPNLFGLVQGEQNAIQPGKRMLSSMLPTVVLDRAGRPLLIVGARGGPRIVSSVTQAIINVIDHALPLADAINAPRVHHQGLPDTLRLERTGFAATRDSLALLGYATSPLDNIGSVNGIMRTQRGWVAYSDPRSGGRPVAY